MELDWAEHLCSEVSTADSYQIYTEALSILKAPKLLSSLGQKELPHSLQCFSNDMQYTRIPKCNLSMHNHKLIFTSSCLHLTVYYIKCWYYFNIHWCLYFLTAKMTAILHSDNEEKVSFQSTGLLFKLSLWCLLCLLLTICHCFKYVSSLLYFLYFWVIRIYYYTGQWTSF